MKTRKAIKQRQDTQKIYVYIFVTASLQSVRVFSLKISMHFLPPLVRINHLQLKILSDTYNL